jgi:hypothetical protein
MPFSIIELIYQIIGLIGHLSFGGVAREKRIFFCTLLPPSFCGGLGPLASALPIDVSVMGNPVKPSRKAAATSEATK